MKRVHHGSSTISPRSPERTKNHRGLLPTRHPVISFAFLVASTTIGAALLVATRQPLAAVVAFTGATAFGVGMVHAGHRRLHRLAWEEFEREFWRYVEHESSPRRALRRQPRDSDG